MFLMEVADHPLGATWVMPVFSLAAVFLPSVRRKHHQNSDSGNTEVIRSAREP